MCCLVVMKGCKIFQVSASQQRQRLFGRAAGNIGGSLGQELDELCREAEALQEKFAALQASKAHEQQHLKQLEFDAALSAISAAAESLRTAAAATLTEPASKPAAPLQRQLTESDQSNLEHIEEGIRWPSEYGSQKMQKTPFWEQIPRTGSKLIPDLGGFSATLIWEAPLQLCHQHGVWSPKIAVVIMLGNIEDFIANESACRPVEQH